MGIVLKQSFYNTLVLFLGFGIGGINVLFLYTNFLHEDYYGLITFLLSTANILLPLMVFGMQHSVIKFFSAYATDKEKDGFLWSTLIIPLLAIVPIALLGTVFYNGLADLISRENLIIKKYTYLIFLVGLFMGYFEIFYAWTKVQLSSVFGNILKELFARVCSSVLLIAVALGYLSEEQFIYAIVVVYGLRMLVMMVYALYVHCPKIVFTLPSNMKEILSFSSYMIVAGSAAGILLEIDKFMIPQLEQIAEVAYYSVGIYIASVIAIPTRAMQQITSPITAKGMNLDNQDEVGTLYKQSSINLLVVGGLLFLCINLNIQDLYELINKPQFNKGVMIVLIISVAKLFELAMGTGNAILVNSKYYRIFFYLSLAMALSVIVLNRWLISIFGINGAAMATLMVVAIFNLIKILYIKGKLSMQPFSLKTVKLLVLIGLVYVGFLWVDFGFNPLIEIILKSVLVAGIYGIVVVKLRISDELNSLWSGKLQL